MALISSLQWKSLTREPGLRSSPSSQRCPGKFWRAFVRNSRPNVPDAIRTPLQPRVRGCMGFDILLRKRLGTVRDERAHLGGDLVAMPGFCGGTMVIRTSETDPIRVDFLPRAVHKMGGDIGLTLAPGKQDVANGWFRDLGMDMVRLRTVFRSDCLVSLLEVSEFAALGIPELDTFAVANGIRPVFFQTQTCIRRMSAIAMPSLPSSKASSLGLRPVRPWSSTVAPGSAGRGLLPPRCWWPEGSPRPTQSRLSERSGLHGLSRRPNNVHGYKGLRACSIWM